MSSCLRFWPSRGDGPFGKQIRKLADDQDNELTLDEGWRGKDPIIKLSLSTLGTVGSATGTQTETTEGTESRTESEKATADHSDPGVDEGDPLAETKDAIERLFDEHPEFVKEPDPEAIAVELFYWDYLYYIPAEAEVRQVLDSRTACEAQTDV